MATSVETLTAQAEHIGDSLLEAAISVMFSPSVQSCDALIATATGAITFGRALRVELLKSKTTEAA